MTTATMIMPTIFRARTVSGSGDQAARQRQHAHAFARRSKYRIRNRREGGGGSSLTKAARLFGAVDDMHLDRRRLVHAQDAIGVEICLLHPPVMERDLAVQRGGYPKYETALELRAD